MTHEKSRCIFHGESWVSGNPFFLLPVPCQPKLLKEWIFGRQRTGRRRREQRKDANEIKYEKWKNKKHFSLIFYLIGLSFVLPSFPFLLSNSIPARQTPRDLATGCYEIGEDEENEILEEEDRRLRKERRKGEGKTPSAPGLFSVPFVSCHSSFYFSSPLSYFCWIYILFTFYYNSKI